MDGEGSPPDEMLEGQLRAESGLDIIAPGKGRAIGRNPFVAKGRRTLSEGYDVILDTIGSLSRYASSIPGLAAAEAFILDPATADLPPGRYELSGGLYALVQEYRCAPASEKRWEIHRERHDLQFIVSGEECIGWSAALVDPEPYDSARDIAFGDEVLSPTELRLPSGHFAFFFALEAHRPGIIAPGASDSARAVRKIVVKLPAH